MDRPGTPCKGDVVTSCRAGPLHAGGNAAGLAGLRDVGGQSYTPGLAWVPGLRLVCRQLAVGLLSPGASTVRGWHV